MKKYKVINDYGINITLNFTNLDGRVVKILPNSFGYINEDQLLYLSSSSKILESGLIRLEEDAKEVPDVKEQIVEDNIFSKGRIQDMLSLSIKALEDEIAKTDNVLGLKALLEEAEKADKTKGYIQALNKRIEELV
ncbi:hypothetical protein HKO22_02870 [Peptoniphilus sp. AGMB00490]|uniref:Uncharacterized protein n=1 Tax=Peptoniphilus faecalis TaxID=2731255 RepID=A0A848RHF6_9FIRM|nr:hypothetical protein [Peptoniphilus faecalis]NMW84686.1 hypothetical protein [Peptoniphilus faecalis]